MAAHEKPPIVGTAVMGWRDGLGAINAMPAVAGMAALVLLVIGVLSALLMPDPGPGLGEVAPLVSGILSNIVQAFVLAPLAIAVHRYVLLGEVTPHYALDASNPRYMRFVGFAILVKLLMAIPGLIFVLAAIFSAVHGAAAIAGIAGLVASIAVGIVALRRTILFPAIAVDAAGATWSNARNDTMGNSWRIAFILFCVMIPVLVLSLLLYFALMWPLHVATTFDRVAFAVISTAVQILSICALAAVASHIFRALADRLAVPPGSAPA